MKKQTRKGILLASSPYFYGAFLPLFWHQLTGSTALQTLSHRILWSFVFSLVVLISQHQIRNFIHLFKSPKIIGFYAITALLLATNWLIYIWAVAKNAFSNLALAISSSLSSPSCSGSSFSRKTTHHSVGHPSHCRHWYSLPLLPALTNPLGSPQPSLFVLSLFTP